MVDPECAITMVVATRNRAHTLRLVLPSFLAQDGVAELILVDDAGTEDLAPLVAELGAHHPGVRTRLTRNAERAGAAESRNRGAALASHPYILFCDDDEYLEPGYAATCLGKLIQRGAGAVSGRRIYMRNGEAPAAAAARFGQGSRSRAPFDTWLCELIAGSRFEGDVAVPFTNAIIVTRTDLVRRFGFDRHYFEGNGYREESDYQMNLYVNGFEIVITGDTHSIHLPPAQIRRPGMPARSRSRGADVYWSVRHTGYFYRKYWDRYARRRGLRLPRQAALGWFAAFVTYRTYVRPTLLSVAFRLFHLRDRMLKSG